MRLREYQHQAVQALIKHDYSTGHPVILMCTGSGKSFVIAAFIDRILSSNPSTHVLMLVHSRELVKQNAAEYTQATGREVGIWSAGLNSKQLHQVTFASYQSFRNIKNLPLFDVIIIDECDLVDSKNKGTYRQLLANLASVNPAIKAVGLTATDYRTGAGDICHGDEAYFNRVIYEYSYDQALEEGYVVPLVAKETKSRLLDSDIAKIPMVAGEFSQKFIATLVNKKQFIIDSTRELIQLGAQRKKWLLFCSGTEHIQSVMRELKQSGITADYVTATTPLTERDEIIQRFESGKIQALINNAVFTTGFNVKAVDLIGLLYPINSLRKYVQILGRGTRTYPGKKDCLVLDFSNTVMRLGYFNHARAWTPKAKTKSNLPPAMRACPDCLAIHLVQVRACPCGYQFPVANLKKFIGKSYNGKIISKEDFEPPPVIKNKEISAWRIGYMIKRIGSFKSKGYVTNANVAQIEYFLNGKTAYAKEFVNEKGIKEWWAEHQGLGDAPLTARDLILRKHEAKRPKHIVLDRTGKYPKIKSKEF